MTQRTLGAPAPHSPPRCPFWVGSWTDQQGQEEAVLGVVTWLLSCLSFLSVNCWK